MASESTAIHMLAGGLGGTAGAVVTCPLEVVKTRQQSSCASFSTPMLTKGAAASFTKQSQPLAGMAQGYHIFPAATTSNGSSVNSPALRSHSSISLIGCLRYIVKNEGPGALWKGLGPNLVGVAPSRAIYFCAYAQTKKFCNSVMKPETPMVHICSAACAGFTASTMTNPIWFIKTRVQLDQTRYNSLSVMHCIRKVHSESGIRGFYKGITASYYGILETVIHFVIYEAIKAELRASKGQCMDDEECTPVDFIEFMAAGAVSKTCATCAAYPHEVARTRLREEGNTYRGFWQTLHLVFKLDGIRGLYRGLGTQLVRQIPNTAIMMSTYEFVVHMCNTRSSNGD